MTSARAAGTSSSDTLAALALTSREVIRAGQDASGAFIAGPTFSQYRYAWLRDGAFIAEALDLVGEIAAAARFHDWVAGVIVGASDGVARSIAAGRSGRVPDHADHLHCRYQLDGSAGTEEWPTYQLDGPGIWLWSLAHHVRHGGAMTASHAEAAALAGRYLAALWQVPSADAWEEHPEQVHTSTLVAVLAGLRALQTVAPEVAAEADVAVARAGLEQRICGSTGSLTKWNGNDAVDASLLWAVAPYALFDPDEPRAQATVERVASELTTPGGGVHRYLADTYYGGGEWLLLTAALARVRLRRGHPGDREAAQTALRWMAAQADGDGMLPEQVADHAFHPSRIAEWQALWGQSARPLLWSHATYLALYVELGLTIPALTDAS